MMKFQAALSAGLATFLVVPAIAVGNDDVASFEEALANTNRALELLGGIRTKIDEGSDSATGLILSVTEAPILDARRRDERLMGLRNDIGLLQTELELLESAGLPGTPVTVPPTTASTTAPIDVTGTGPLPKVHTGLDDATRLALLGLGKDETDDPDAGGGSTDGRTPTRPVTTSSPEGPGYSANVILQARACFRAGRHEQGALLLEGIEDDPEALYWRARCREKLERLDEAIADLTRVLELTTDESQVKRAKADLQFIEWKKGFLEKLDPKGKKAR